MSADRLAQVRAAWERAVEKDKVGDAIKALVQLEALDPREPLWSHRLGDALRRVGQKAEAAAAFARAMNRYQARGFLPRAIAMAKLAASLEPSFSDLVRGLTPESAVRPSSMPATVSLRPVPLARAKDERHDEVRFEDAPAPSSISFVLEDVDIEVVRDAMPTIPAAYARAAPPEPSIDRVAAMVGFRLFADVSRAALVALASAAELIEFIPGAIVIMRDEPAYALYAIVGGSACVEIRGGAAIRLGEGEVFGEACLIDEGRRQADVRAESRLSTLRIGKSDLDAVVEAHPEVKDALFHLLARRLVANVVQTSPLFSVFEPKVRLELVQLFEVRRAEAGAVLAEAGRKIDGLYVLLAGELIARGADGSETRVARGSTFGHGSLVGGEASDVTLRAVTELVVLRLPASKFGSLAALYPPALAHLSETAGEPLRPSLTADPPRK